MKYGSTAGNLYKPESDSVAVGNKNPNDINKSTKDNSLQGPPDMNNENDSIQMQNLNDSDTSSNTLKFNENMSPNIKGSFGRSSSGANLVWNGDDISNYSAIFDNAIFKTTTSDDNDNKNFKNTNLAISPNNKSSSNNVINKLTLLSIALLSLSIPFVLFFKKRKFASK